MKKIKLFLCVALFGAMSFGAFSAYDYYTMSAEEKALLENIEALTSCENPDPNSHSGWLWCKHWANCTIISQIVVTQSCGSFSVGAYHPAGVGFEAAITSCGGSYSNVKGGLGQKTYCYDGWDPCSSSDCR